MMATYSDPIVAEVHKTREKLLKEHGGADGYAEHLRQLEARLADRITAREPRPPIKTKRRAS